ncbi:MAG: 1-(5-phosphoribosyl)-5-[(5-phosphoribosylamino)methylideneamino]imidazole-4-carboxamide isomerase [Promethearchaeota archaeon]
MFQVIPAIDLRAGKCVRLFKGKIGTEKIYYDDPISALKNWTMLGAKFIHIVDLDAATGNGDNLNVINNLLKWGGSKVKIEVGGGIRTYERAEHLLKARVQRVVIGTAAIKDQGLIRDLSNAFGPDRIVVALDHKNEKVQINGWTEDSNKNIYKMAKIMQKNGAGYILLSSVEMDGTFSGPDINTTKKMVDSVQIPVLAAGGTRNLEDVINLRNIGCSGVVIGKALYEGRIDFPTALQLED